MSKGTVVSKINQTGLYEVRIPGFDGTKNIQCVTLDDLDIGDSCAIADIDNEPPNKDRARLLPNTGEYIYIDDRTWFNPEFLKKTESFLLFFSGDNRMSTFLFSTAFLFVFSSPP